MDEFSLINKYFDWDQGIGDDCALISIDHGKQLATTVDTLIEGVHFPANTSAQDIAYKALAVNLSDLAAMGATPLYFTLALSLPSVDKKWLADFSQSLKALAKQYNISLVGGDTSKGKLSITINATGFVEKNQALLRSGAQAGDPIFVSNTLGDAALAWQQIQKQQTPSSALLKQFNRPEPQVVLAQSLLGIANSCIDISDGLEQDLSHILTCSKVGAGINLEALPLSSEVAQHIANTQDWCVALAGGDDYELCFTVPNAYINRIKAIEKDLDIKLTKIGAITKKKGLKIKGLEKHCKSYQHF
ncbi:thiamine-phosphate kinase [bacterium endosymbiont of Bathymodiolus sp. 5 South]|uniref:thiamine-phosphate kinase n=1 Tax=bacterium endosymbiont of Bathymodiolus sp. 5 South TaxID=1181670 RepID=UPI0010AF42E2|nr:thiamine-phosphate kinase [bacterium endosymbiont of Bathymodiolus sp. 5 South]CAC9648743.1 Thiamine-monophosphate kinase (EC 2.7.4.16) [uncultured Gammaproteobacteria bacterium]CAC9655162.1 Thiamine-monophosphate kinase (EC 2.7.4.16) [uncultured Gammaproteobacteria bacterium]SHN91235.1 Thiamine-monophosphate kinase [bacterium endosymbiont of Bathymodiolus sp. 5 South]SSC07698.1 Thiamine-monophosphate kinase [bacterium endosymbiont of Bathymodiolus sp. 5 South]VVH60074.1 Thiamine-monophosph